MQMYLLDTGCKMTTRLRQCSDGEEYEILEIRGPKASGFFIFYFFCVCKNEKSV